MREGALTLFLLPWKVYSYRGALGVSLEIHQQYDDLTSDCGGLDPAGGGVTNFSSHANIEKCASCVNLSCMWCPFTQTCISNSARNQCPQRGTVPKTPMRQLKQLIKEQDTPIRSGDNCSSRQDPPWIRMMRRYFGDNWEVGGRFLDVQRCVEWSLGWPVTPSEHMENASADEIGKWGCKSALFREAIMVLTNRTFAGEAFTAGAQPKQQRPAANQKKDLVRRSGWKVRTWYSKLCEYIKFKFRRRRCYTRIFGEKAFAQLRSASSLPNGKNLPGVEMGTTDRLADAIRSGPLVSFKAGAGKSGSGFCRTWDGAFVIKMGLRHGNLWSRMEMDEINNLHNILYGKESDVTLAEHLRTNPSSLLNRYFGLVKVRVVRESTYALIMADATYGLLSRTKMEAKRATLQFAKYDLKGESRDQDRISEPGKGTLENGDFKRNEHNAMVLTDSQCLKFRDVVEKDTEFLQGHNLIDYSFFIFVLHRNETSNSSDAVGCKGTPGEPHCFEHGNNVYTVGIIDYLNNLNSFKTVESVLRHGKFRDYGAQIVRFAKRICRTHDEKEFMKRVKEAMLQRGSGSVDTAFKRADQDGDGYIDMRELQEYLQLNEGDVMRLFKEVDGDGNDFIDASEFKWILE